MRNTVLFILICTTVGCFNRKPVKSGLEGKPMPSFSLLLMDSATKLNTSNFPSGQPIVLFFFSPLCPYCRAETEDIIANLKSFSKIRFYMFTNNSFFLLKKYYDQYELNKYPNITVGRDYDSYFINYFKVTSVPFMAIYTKDKMLKQVLIGKIRPDIIKEIAIN